MADRDQSVEQLYQEAVSKRMNRRAILARGMALGLSLPAIASVAARAQDASPAASPAPMTSPAQNGPVHVSIVNKDMSLDDIKAAIAEEKEVTVGNWTYAANDQLIKRFQDYVKTVYGVDVKLNYVGSQSPSTYIADLYTTAAAGGDSAVRRDGDRGELLGPGSVRLQDPEHHVYAGLPAVRSDPER